MSIKIFEISAVPLQTNRMSIVVSRCTCVLICHLSSLPLIASLLAAVVAVSVPPLVAILFPHLKPLMKLAIHNISNIFILKPVVVIRHTSVALPCRVHRSDLIRIIFIFFVSGFTFILPFFIISPATLNF